MAAGIRFEGVTKRFGDQEAVSNLNLEVEAGKRLALLGPSGCGKTTALRMLAGIEVPDAGRISLNGDLVNDPRLLIPPGERKIGMVFQSLALWPHMTVEKNLMFVQGRGADPGRVGKLLDMVNLSGERGSYPHELSGGERQRVALARALVAHPKALLMDEPMANLDEGLKRDLLKSVRRLQEEFDVTMIYVTHDQREALAVAETLAVMEGGRIHQSGPPLDLYYKPSNEFVARFLGRNNILSGEVSKGRILCPAGSFPIEGGPAEGPVTAALRAEDVTLNREEHGPLVVSSCDFRGGRYTVRCEAGGMELTAEVIEPLSPGSQVTAGARRPAYALPSG